MRPLLLVALSLLVASPAFAGDKHAKRFNEAKTIVEDLGSQITEDTWKQARCTTVLHIGKGGFLFGGTGGWGVVTCREEGGGWSPPAILKAGGPTFGSGSRRRVAKRSSPLPRTAAAPPSRAVAALSCPCCGPPPGRTHAPLHCHAALACFSSAVSRCARAPAMCFQCSLQVRIH